MTIVSTILLLIKYLTFFISISLLISFIKKNKRISSNDPPQRYFALPLLGHLHLLGTLPHRSLTRMSQTYGDKVQRLWFGDKYTVVVSDPAVIREIWVKNFDNFTDRGLINSIAIYSGNYNDLAFSDGPLWRKSRGLVATVFTKTKLKSINQHLSNQSQQLIESMKPYQQSTQLFYCKKFFSKYAINVILKLVFSQEIPYKESVDDGKMKRLTDPIHAVFKTLGSGSLSDYISVLAPLFYYQNQTFKRKVECVEQFVREIYDDHLTNLDSENPKDVLDLLILEFGQDNVEQILHIAMDFLLAGSDSNAGTVEWFCLYMINNPNIQRKAYDELLGQVGRGNQPDLSHRVKTPYLNAIIREIMRCRPIGPLGLPRVASDDITVCGYFIPKGTQMIQNIYGVHHDKEYWVDPHIFKPERFLTDNHTEYWLNFSCGPRNCIGMNLALDVVYLACSAILMNFELSSPNTPIDDTEVFGLTIHPRVFPISLGSR